MVRAYAISLPVRPLTLTENWSVRLVGMVGATLISLTAQYRHATIKIKTA